MDITIELQNSIRLLISGWLYDTDPSDDVDEFDKMLEVPKILREMAYDYEKEINKNLTNL